MTKFRLSIFLKPLLLSFLLSGASNITAAEEGGIEFGDLELVSVCGGFIESPTFDQDGNLWLLDIPADRVLQIDKAGNCVERGKTGGIPNGLLFHEDGRLFVANTNGIGIFDQATGEVEILVSQYQNAPIVGANDLIFDANGGLYFTASNNSDLFNSVGQVFYVPEGRSEPELFVSGLSFPNGIALSADGRAVLIAEFTAKRIVSVPALGLEGGGPSARYVFAYTEGGIGPDGMTMDDHGRLFAANLGAGTVQGFDGAGRKIGIIEFPVEAGMLTSNVISRDGFLYITESSLGQVWRVRIIE